MSMGNPVGGYTQPYGSSSAANMYGGGFGAGTYDPMLGFGQASGMGTTYPTRFSADYSRFAQSGMPFNQPVMGYNTYGQIFSQPQRQAPSFGGKGGGGFGGFRPQPPAMGGKGGGGFQPGYGYQPQFPGMMAGGPGFRQQFPRRPERRTNQLGLNQPQPNPVPPPRPVMAEDRSIVGRSNEFLESAPRENVGEVFGLAGMPKQTVDPNQGSYQKYEIPYQGGALEQARGTVDQNAYNPAFKQQQQFLAQQRQISDRAPQGIRPTADQFIDRPVAQPAVQPAVQPVDFSGVDFSRNFSSDLFGGLGGRFGAMQFQEGGQVPPDAASNMELMLSEAGPANPQAEMAGEYDRLIQMTMQAVLGQTENADEIIQMFIDEFGVDAFRQLRDAVLKQQVPGAQTEGMVDGNGGGMDDQVMGMIGNQRPVAVSPGEYIVPADVVSGLGDGSSKSGADILDELNQAVRMARTGTTEQPRPLMETLQQ